MDIFDIHGYFIWSVMLYYWISDQTDATGFEDISYIYIYIYIQYLYQNQLFPKAKGHSYRSLIDRVILLHHGNMVGCNPVNIWWIQLTSDTCSMCQEFQQMGFHQQTGYGQAWAMGRLFPVCLCQGNGPGVTPLAEARFPSNSFGR